MIRPNLEARKSRNSLSDLLDVHASQRTSLPAAEPSGMHVKRFTLTSKPNWWLVEVDEESENTYIESDDTAVSESGEEAGILTANPSATMYTPFRDHPTQLFQFPTPPAYSAPPNPTSHLSPMAAGSTSELFRAVIKKPDVITVEINGELQSNTTDVRNQFLAELRVYRTVTRHRNIVAFFGCLENLGMVLEYVDGRPLFDVIRDPNRKLEREMKVDFHNQLLSGLAHVHSFGLSHGDLSLLNVHVTNTYNTLKILDFGRSTAAPSYTDTPREMSFGAKRHHHHYSNHHRPRHSASTPIESQPPETIYPGTRPFTAPEVLRGECKDPILADAYSFGMILLCIDLNNLVDMDPEYQKADGKVDTSGCEIFSARIRWYMTPWRERRKVRKEDRYQ